MTKHIGDFYLDKDAERRLEDPATLRSSLAEMFAEPKPSAMFTCERCGYHRGVLSLGADAAGNKIDQVAKCAGCGHEQQPPDGNRRTLDEAEKT